MTEHVKVNPEWRSLATAKPVSFHHVGFAVASIEKLAPGFARSLGANWNGEIIHDAVQEARVAFLYCGDQRNPAVELVEPAGETSRLHKFLTRGGGLHHICYEVDSLDDQLRESRAGKCLVVKNPLPAVAFGGRRIAWIYTPEKLLVEYLER